MALAMGRPTLAISLLALWVIPPPFAVSNALSPGLEHGLAWLAAGAAEAGGLHVVLNRRSLEIAGATLGIRQTDGGIPLAIYLAGIGWWSAVRAGGGIRDALASAARTAPLGFVAQALLLCIAFALLAGRAPDAARAVLDHGAWPVLALALYRARPARIRFDDGPGRSAPAARDGRTALNRESATTGLVVITLLVVGSIAWSLALRPALRVDATALDALPTRLGSWTSEDVPVESTVESILQADYNVQRRYRHEFGDVVWVYFGYYGTERGGTPEHTPRVCFKAQGWEIEDHDLIEVTDELRVNELVVSLGGERHLVHYWFRSFRKTGLRGAVDQMLDRMVGRLFHDRADGSLVRVSTRIENGDRDSARSLLLAFDGSFDAVLAAHWPREAAENRGRRRLGPTSRSVRRRRASRSTLRRGVAWVRAPRVAGPLRRSPVPARSSGPAPG